MSAKDESLESKSIIRRVSAQENNVHQKDNEPTQTNFECPICIYWLKEPVLTSCGHRFCRECITSWLQTQNPSCPIDNHHLTEKDLFPDNFTRREIQQLRQPCVNSAAGCETVVSPLDMDVHLALCAHGLPPTSRSHGAASVAGDKQSLHECTFKICGCKFTAIDEQAITDHLSAETVIHLNMLMTAFNKTPQTDNLIQPTTNNENPVVTPHHAWDAPAKTVHKAQPQTNQQSGTVDVTAACGLGGTSEATAAAMLPPKEEGPSALLLKTLYERIVMLEQQGREKDAQLNRVVQQLSRLTVKTASMSAIDSRYSGGVLVWRIDQFQSKMSAMSADPNEMFYSGDAYTSPHGYRYCVRINISPKVSDFIGLHVHLMQSDNDYHLDWPFRGRIKISMIHPNLNDTKNDIIMSKPEIMAFHRPTQDVSPRGFGFLEYASISHVLSHGFIVDDVLTVKVQVGIV